jgi:hypothetical protein
MRRFVWLLIRLACGEVNFRVIFAISVREFAAPRHNEGHLRLPTGRTHSFINESAICCRLTSAAKRRRVRFWRRSVFVR